jgi:hypothetical protein
MDIEKLFAEDPKEITEAAYDSVSHLKFNKHVNILFHS